MFPAFHTGIPLLSLVQFLTQSTDALTPAPWSTHARVLILAVSKSGKTTVDHQYIIQFTVILVKYAMIAAESQWVSARKYCIAL